MIKYIDRQINRQIDGLHDRQIDGQIDMIDRKKFKVEIIYKTNKGD